MLTIRYTAILHLVDHIWGPIAQITLKFKLRQLYQNYCITSPLSVAKNLRTNVLTVLERLIIANVM